MIQQRTADAMLGRTLTAGGATIGLTQLLSPYIEVFNKWQELYLTGWGVTLSDDYKAALLQAVTLGGVYLGLYLRQRVVAAQARLKGDRDEEMSQLQKALELADAENGRLAAQVQELRGMRLGADQVPHAAS